LNCGLVSKRIFEIFRSLKFGKRQSPKSFESISIFGAFIWPFFAILLSRKAILKGLMIEFLIDKTKGPLPACYA